MKICGFFTFTYVRFITIMTKSKIPDRWLDYKPVGEAVKGTRFLPFKVPLKESLHESNELPKEQRFTPADLVDTLAESNRQLGLLIDLTFTRRYYNSQDITDSDIQYEKIFTAGHHVPKSDVVKRFTTVVKKFLEDNADNDLLIGVHCTHGVNRTGYLICRYMIDHLEIKPDDALKAYENARGYPVERVNYIEDLKTRPREDDEDEDEPNYEDTSPGKRKYYDDDRTRDYNKRGRSHYGEYSSNNYHQRDYYGNNRGRYDDYDSYNRQSYYDNGGYYGRSHYDDRRQGGWDNGWSQGWDDGRYSRDYSRDEYRDTRRHGRGYSNDRYNPYNKSGRGRTNDKY